MDFQYFDCCKDMFSAKPTFTSHGTCFTTKMSLTPKTKSPLKFVLNASKQYSQGTHIQNTLSFYHVRPSLKKINQSQIVTFSPLGLDLSLIGTQFASSGASIAFHKDDHGMTAIEKRGISLSAGTFNKFDVKQIQVNILIAILASNSAHPFLSGYKCLG